MTSSEQVKLAPGHQCLLDLLERKLWQNVENYLKLKNEKESGQARDGIDAEILKSRNKIKRISARQKRYTSELINGNGNNSIPKESFFEALGLITRETLNKLNSKTNERRRRTTANPRFSHEAVQARRLALEPVQKKPAEPRVKKVENKNRELLIQNEKLILKCENLQRQIDAKVKQIGEKRDNNKRLEQQNDDIRKQGLELISALNMMSPAVQRTGPLDIWIDMKCDESLDGVD